MCMIPVGTKVYRGKMYSHGCPLEGLLNGLAIWKSSCQVTRNGAAPLPFFPSLKREHMFASIASGLSSERRTWVFSDENSTKSQVLPSLPWNIQGFLRTGVILFSSLIREHSKLWTWSNTWLSPAFPSHSLQLVIVLYKALAHAGSLLSHIGC